MCIVRKITLILLISVAPAHAQSSDVSDMVSSGAQDDILNAISEWLPGRYSNERLLANSTQENIIPLLTLEFRPLHLLEVDGDSYLMTVISEEKTLVKLPYLIINFIHNKDLAILRTRDTETENKEVYSSNTHLKKQIFTRYFIHRNREDFKFGDEIATEEVVEANPWCRPRVFIEDRIIRLKFNGSGCYHGKVPTLMINGLSKDDLVVWNLLAGPHYYLERLSVEG